MSGGGFRVSIPSSEMKMIENIKEVAGNHSDEEIYAMLKECSMDPDETAQKLLLQDHFHEVKSKRERRKENANNREPPVESRWKSGSHGRGGKSGRANFSPRYVSHDAVAGRNSVGKENGINQVVEKGISYSLPTSQETKTRERSLVKSSLPVVGDGPTSITSGSPAEITPSSVDINHKGTALTPVAVKNLTNVSGTSDSHKQLTEEMNNCLVPVTPASSSAAHLSSLESVLVPSEGAFVLDALEKANSDVDSHQPLGELNTINHEENNINAAQGNIPSKPQSSTSTHGDSSTSRPSSNYNNRPQQTIGSQKVGNKEWKPKATNSVAVQGSGTVATAASEVPVITFGATSQSEPASKVLDSEEVSKLQKKMGGLDLLQGQLVIIPNHIHVPESERTKLSFGSFGVGFGVTTSYRSSPESEKSPAPVSESSHAIDENSEQQTSSNQNALATAEEGDYPDPPQSPTHKHENIPSGEGDISSSAIEEYNDMKQETALASGGHQQSVVHASQNYGFGFVPPIVSQLPPFESSDSQARDVSRLPSFVPYDPASYYAQYYRSGVDSDGRLSPFSSAPGIATKYNGNVAVLPPLSSQSPQEGGVLSTASPTALVTQAAGLMQSSVAVTQQPVTVFRPPTGLHISHFPPNYFPYGHYFSPFYVPPPPIHQFLGNNAFPQQPQAGSVYPAPQAAAAAAAVKYSLPQYKLGANSGNSTQIGIPSGYGPYGSSPSGYNPSSTATGGNSTTNEDLSASPFKENNVYITGPQSEGSAVWVAAPGREISNLQTNSFYNFPTQGQHVTFTPSQAGHGTFASIYHPAQATASVHPLLQQSQPHAVAGAVDMVGPGGSVYQQSQHSQNNWPSNY